MGAVLRHDFECLRALFQDVYVCCAGPHPPVQLCRGTQPECGQELLEKLRRRLSGAAVIVLACIIFSVFASSLPAVDPDAAAASMVWSYIGELVFNMLILVGSVKMSDHVVREMMGL